MRLPLGSANTKSRSEICSHDRKSIDECPIPGALEAGVAEQRGKAAVESPLWDFRRRARDVELRHLWDRSF